MTSFEVCQVEPRQIWATPGVWMCRGQQLRSRCSRSQYYLYGGGAAQLTTSRGSISLAFIAEYGHPSTLSHAFDTGLLQLCQSRFSINCKPALNQTTTSEHVWSGGHWLVQFHLPPLCQVEKKQQTLWTKRNTNPFPLILKTPPPQIINTSGSFYY